VVLTTYARVAIAKAAEMGYKHADLSRLTSISKSFISKFVSGVKDMDDTKKRRLLGVVNFLQTRPKVK
jgi:hypothetical protein